MDKSLPEYQLPPEYEAQLEEALTHAALFSNTREEALAWIKDRGLELIVSYAKDGNMWFADMLNNPDDAMTDKARAFIWIVAYHISKAAPKELTPGQYEKWTFALLSLGYMMRMDHESNSQKG